MERIMPIRFIRHCKYLGCSQSGAMLANPGFTKYLYEIVPAQYIHLV